MSLLDQLPKENVARHDKQLKRYNFILLIGGLLFAGWLFVEIYFTKQSMYELRMPNDFATVTSTNAEYQLIFLIVGIGLSQITFFLQRFTGIIILILTYLLVPFAFTLISFIS